jgi:dihydroorotate dehydrogenase
MRQLDRAYSIAPIRFLLKRSYQKKSASLHRKLWGIDFPNPVGLAAGFDKDAKHIDALACLGFGFIEIGTLTPKAQDGNPAPRLFRLPTDKALINRMGFNNGGVDAAVLRLQQRKERIIIGGNIGKNKITPNEEAYKDYEYNVKALHAVVDYFVVNVSSPNTPGLRELQEKAPLMDLLHKVQAVNKALPNPKPVLLKIAPDLTDTQLDDIIEIVAATQIDGIVATNTTIDRSQLQTPAREVEAIGAGGLSGKPVTARSTEVIRYIHQKTNGSIPMIAVGGIFTAADAIEKLNAGASLVQVYTGFIYEGPGMVKRICNGLLQQKNN